ncbi:phytoene/squalene synthase family protein [Alphaproteobacteria bacterium]|nr:phytoene/squalene synthase family protein [Alphaproteobacteria bacterium]MDB2564548.1 phytoene/squalene synthase family protein [Alphaproteobacteria bacterium]MDB3974206.1 phytoene/squalene synthase family protein [Alphaproteobacteria bacterium]MDC0594961.1 phytoene/squalene synthase family protein [Alphaproteobacteria bacterium]
MTQYYNDPNSLKKHGKSFYWASFFLPKRNKDAATKLYSICRFFDDLADDNNEDQTKILTGEFKKICDDLSHPINEFFTSHNLSIKILGDLVDGLVKDQTDVRIKNEKELIQYAYQVAGTVGLMMSPLIMVNNNKANKHAIDLGIAMQLTNIARDIYEDALMNRIYLPQDWISNTNISELTDISSNKDLIQIKSAIKRLILLSETYYKNGFAGMRYIPLKTRLAIFFAAKIYRAIGQKIKKNRYEYSYKRIYVSTIEKLFITFISIPEFVFLNLRYNKYQLVREIFQNENL